MSTRTVGNQAVFVTGSYSQPYTIRNAGTVDVYLGQDSSLTVDTRSITLTRGASMQWDGSTDLWAICETGQTGIIEWIYQGGSSITDGTTVVEIPGGVTVSGDVNVTNAVIPISGDVGVSGNVGILGTVPITGDVNIAGGAVSITGGVTVSGDVNVNGSTINVGNAVEAKTLSTTLKKHVADIVANETVIYDSGSLVPLSSYQSIIVSCGNVSTLGSGAVNDLSRLWIQWYTLDGTIVTEEAPLFYANGLLNYITDVKASRLIVKLVSSYHTATGYTALPILIIGSSALLDERYYSEPASITRYFGCTIDGQAINPQAKLVAVDFTLTAASATLFIPNLGGDCTVTIRRISGTAVSAYLSVAAFASTGNTIVGNGDITTLPRRLSLPSAPVIITATGSAGARIAVLIGWD